MIKITLYIPFLVLIIMTMISTRAQAVIPENSQQLILVIAEDWETIKASLSLFQRKNSESPWIRQGESLPAVIGKKGLGWGRGIYDPQDAQNYFFRKEGDKRAPAGIFTIGSTFGALDFNSVQKLFKIKMPYLQLKEGIRCIDDSHSQHYNTLIDTAKVEKDWSDNGYEDMYKEAVISVDKVYRWGFFIDHNSDKNPLLMKKEMFAGSCIFLHVWESSDIGTSGCTALEENNVLKIISFLDQKKIPVFVQLPRSEYLRLKEKWQLP